jgi:AraC family transcriptional regulator of adaptative response / DNA-3-methyladenine glycosylase II
MGSASLALSYLPPYDHQALLRCLAQRAVSGLELCPAQGVDFARVVRFADPQQAHIGWVALRFDPTHHQVHVSHSESLLAVWPQLLQQVRWALDLDADPAAIEPVLAKDFGHCAGWRVPGTWDGFELAVRAVLGQQITVAAAKTLTQRLVQTLGEPLATPWPELTHAFPTPAGLKDVADETLGQLGIVRQRQRAIKALAQAVCEGHLSLQPGVDLQATLATLLSLHGIGEWTAQYIAMRALRWPDAFPSGDVVLQQRLGVRGGPQPARAAQALSQVWQPWRSYAVIRLWHGHEG